MPLKLDDAEFTVSEDHSLEPRPISSVKAIVNPDLPIAVVIVLDVSGSMQGQAIADAKTAALRFLDRLGPNDRAALIAFADTVDLEGVDPTREHPFTGDLKPLYAIVEGLRAEGDTPLYDVAYKAVRWAAQEPEGNRAVLLLTDGQEDAGTSGKMGSHTANEDTAIREANRANVPVFTIGLGKEMDEAYLRRLALETGGRYQPAPNSTSLVALFQNVADLLKQQARLTYESGVAADGQEHTVRVEVRAGERVAFDEIAFQAPLSGAAPPTTAPLPTPAPGGGGTAAPTTAPTAAPTTAPTGAPGGTPTPAPLPGTASGLLPWLAAGGVAALLALGGAVGIRRIRAGRRPPVYHCLQCGRELESPDAPCPDCGYRGSYPA